SISYALVVGSHRDGNTSVHRACIRSTMAECDFSRSCIIGYGSSPPRHGPEQHANHSGCWSTVRSPGSRTRSVRSGGIEARTGLRDADVSSIPPISRTAGFPPAGRLAYQAGPTQSVCQLKPAPGIRWPSLGLSSPVVQRVADLGGPGLGGAMVPIIPRHSVGYPTYPRGPRSGPGYVVLVHHHLIGPMRPTRRHTATSPPSGLYAVPSLCGSA